MELFNKLPKRSGIYHIKDNIEHLRLRIHFRQVNTLLQLPTFDLNKNVVDDTLTPTDDEATPTEDTAAQQKVLSADLTTVTVNWQQKILSSSERQLYTDLRNCITDVQKNYHQLLLGEQNAAKGKSGVGGKKRRTKKRSRRNAAAKAADEKATVATEEHVNLLFTYTAKDNFHPDPAKETVSHNGAPNINEHPETMYVYAALNPDTQLVALSWYPQQKMLHIYPDFNSMQDRPYFVEIDTDYRHLYAYAIVNVSPARAKATAATAADYIQLPELLLHWGAANESSAQFARPPKHQQRVSLLLEIRCAAGFQYDNIHVRYHVAPPSFTILEEGMLEASTHSSSMAAHNSAERSCHFGYTCQLTMLCEEAFDADDLLHIYFELISIDGWKRERIEGYAHYATYLRAGSDSLRLDCMRPVNGGWIEALKRYFIGGRAAFEYERFFTGAPEAVRFHSRYGSRMRTTGQLDISCQRFVQRNRELLQPPARTNGMTLDDIMLAYRMARERLEALLL